MRSDSPSSILRQPDESAWAALALLRWMLAGLVMFSHIDKRFVPPGGFPAAVSCFGAPTAVIGFFLISGYSIAHSYAERPTGYFRRRFLRIYPLYLASVLFTLIVIWFCPPRVIVADGGAYWSAGWRTAVANIFLLQEFAAIPIPFNSALWSLSLEVFYYVLAPIFYRTSPRAIVVLILVSMAAFIYEFTHREYRLYGWHALVFAWPWLIGFLLGRTRAAPALLLGLLGAIIVYATFIQTPQPLSVVTYLLTLLVILSAGWFHFSATARTAANFLGDLSYPLYLFHLPLGFFLYQVAGVRNLAVLLTGILAGTLFFWYVVDLRLKRWFWTPLVNGIADRLLKRFSPARI